MYRGKFAFQNRLGYLIVRGKFTVFSLFYFVFEGTVFKYQPLWAYIRRGHLTEGFLHYGFEGLIFGILLFLVSSYVVTYSCFFLALRIFIFRMYPSFWYFCCNSHSHNKLDCCGSLQVSLWCFVCYYKILSIRLSGAGDRE